MFTSPDARLQEISLLVFAQLAHYIGETLIPQLSTLHSVFLRNLSAATSSSDVRIAALAASINFVQCLSNPSDRDSQCKFLTWLANVPLLLTWWKRKHTVDSYIYFSHTKTFQHPRPCSLKNLFTFVHNKSRRLYYGIKNTRNMIWWFYDSNEIYGMSLGICYFVLKGSLIIRQYQVKMIEKFVLFVMMIFTDFYSDKNVVGSLIN
ncbi:hypothetical protein RYX36_028600, partial [Vicia faba]